MSTTTLTARSGLTVTIPQSEMDAISARLGPVSARQHILSDAGRALKHRRDLMTYYAQTLSDDDLSLIRAVARQMIRDSAIYVAATELGYGNYVTRAAAGRPMPESWDRIVSRAIAWAGEIDDTPTDRDLVIATQRLGFLTEDDAEYSRNYVRPTWTITAPDGWDCKPANTPEALS